VLNGGGALFQLFVSMLAENILAYSNYSQISRAGFPSCGAVVIIGYCPTAELEPAFESSMIL